MELLYLWIEDYNNIQNQGFNFSSKWKFDYQNEQLSVEERPNAIDDFFGEDIINITALVGANGSGKTSVLEFLYNHFFSNDNDLNGFTNLLVHKQSENIVKYSNFWKSINDPDTFFFFVVKNTNEQFLIEDIKGLTITEERFEKHPTKNKQLPIGSAFPITTAESFKRLPNPASLFYSPFIRRQSFTHDSFDLTTSHHLNGKGYYQDTLSTYLHFQEKTFIKFLNSPIVKNELHNKVLPSYLSNQSLFLSFFAPDDNFQKIECLEISKILNSAVGGLRDFKLFSLITSEASHTLKGSRKQIVYHRFLKSLVISAHQSISYRVTINPNITIYRFIEEDEIYTSIANFDKNEQRKADIQEHIKLIETYLYKLLPIKIEPIIKWFRQLIHKDKPIISDLSITNEEAIKVVEKEEVFYTLIKEKIKILGSTSSEIESMPTFPFFSVKMTGISSGEQHMLQLFARFYSLKQELKDNQHLLILIDEGETSLHPQWQKQYIQLLKETLPLIFEKTPIQIILTSHSPFIVSDLPKENIIFLDTDEQNNTQVVDGLKQKETFGANIHTLFTDAFFMDGGLMGDFAKEQINKVIDFLNNKSSSIKNNEQAQQYINLIGEPIVKRQLQKMLDSRRLKKADTNEKNIGQMKQTLDGLKEQVRLLENQINPSSNDSNKS
jgi:predicted ATPase